MRFDEVVFIDVLVQEVNKGKSTARAFELWLYEVSGERENKVVIWKVM